MNSTRNSFRSFSKELQPFWLRNNATIVFFILLLIFAIYSLFLSTHLKRGIIPDEGYHFELSLQFKPTWGIPPHSRFTESYGLNIRQSPFLGYWLNGRALNILELIFKEPSNWRQLVFLRIVNTVFSIGTVSFTYLISKELINNKWGQLLPVFVLTNTIMFVFLSGGVNYDNPSNFMSTAGLYFLIRVFNKKHYIKNSLGWLFCISLGTLIKITLLPVALITTIFWIIHSIKNKSWENFKNINVKRYWLPISFVIALLVLNFLIYGINYIKSQSLTPSCRDTYSDDVCSTTPFAKRRQTIGLPDKLTVSEAVKLKYPEPLRYFFDTWIRAMLKKIYGIMGHKSYYPKTIPYFHILLYWVTALSFRYYDKSNFKMNSLMGIIGFYTIVLIYKNYNSELNYGFKQVALQGRYIFPVISAIYVLFSHYVMKISNKPLLMITLIIVVFLFIYGGPIRFFILYDSVFASWFV